MVSMSFVRRHTIIAIEEFLYIFFFLQIRRTFWVHFLHAPKILIRQVREMPDESHEFPAIFVVGCAWCAKGGHSGKANAVFNDVKQFAITEPLGGRLSHVGRLRIKSLPNRSVAASVISVAERTMISKVFHGLRENFGTGRHRIRGRASRPRDSQMPEPSSDECLRSGRFVACTETTPNDICQACQKAGDDEKAKHIFEAASFHK